MAKKDLFKPKRYSRESVHKDREYGLFWYDWIWQVVRRVLIILCAFVVIIGVFATGWDKLQEHFFAPMDPDDKTSYAFTISSGSSVTAVARELEKQGFISSATIFKYYVQFFGLTNKLQSGVYYISHDKTVFEVADALTSGKATNERTIRILPGWTVGDIAEYLVNVGALESSESFLDACREYDPYLSSSLALQDADINAKLKGRPYKLEGYLSPDTYRVYLSADAGSIVRTLLKQTDVVYLSIFDHEPVYDESGNMISEATPYGANGVELTKDEIIILASIIEKEASTQEDMARVSAVFYNRLARHESLDSDATIKYISGSKKLCLTADELNSTSQYNSYNRQGLPLGPICNPSKAALTAALNPDPQFLEEGYMFFCSTEPGSGRLVFAKTASEHNNNVARYRPLWEEYDRGVS